MSSFLERIFGQVEPAPVQTRSIDQFNDYPDLATQLATFQRLPRPWKQPSLTEALGVPAVMSAVTLISNTVGMLTLEAYRLGVKLGQADTPRIVQRPNPFSIPRDFFRDTAYSMATRGEAWWWIAARDVDGNPLSLYPMPANEVTITLNERNLLLPRIMWRDKVMPNEDVRQITYLREPSELRGYGPLQKCGAAVSVAVEAQEWAANFFASGGQPSLVIKSAVTLTDTEAANLKAQWVETPNNMPKVIDPGVESVTPFGGDPAKAQLTEARHTQIGEVARMFRIPGSLLEHNEVGSSLTYTNNEQEYTEFLKGCLEPNYLEPIEQTFSDLLTRATTVQFNVDGLLKADIKTRYDVYNVGITAGVLSVDEARQKEGLSPGDIETAPVPLALPQAIPDALPIQVRGLADLRCAKCGKLAGKVSGFAEIKCNRCGAMVRSAA